MVRSPVLIPLYVVLAVFVSRPARSQSYLEAQNVSYNVTSSGFTIECWIKVRNMPGPDPRIARCIGTTEAGCGNASVEVWELYVCGGSCSVGPIGFGLQDGGVCYNIYSSVSVDDSLYHHVAGTYDGTWMRLFVDGAPQDSMSVPGLDIQVTGGQLTVGNATAHNNQFDGRIDELRVWNVARSQAQLLASMGSEISVGPGLVGYWRLSDGTDQVAGKNLIGTGSVAFGGGKINDCAYIVEVPILPQRKYVRAGATGANDGTSWTDAFTDLQSALAVATAGDSIWVAAGTYKPTVGTSRSATFQLVGGVRVYGGFAGTEATIGERDWATNLTVLSGDIGTPADSSDNSFTVVTASGVDSSAVLDGFTMTSGNADSLWTDPSGGGGGILIDGDPVLMNLRIENNRAGYGGGIYVLGGTPLLINVVVQKNQAFDSDGGGMLSAGNPRMINVTFSGNYAAQLGGGMYNTGPDPYNLTNVILWGDSAGAGGDEVYNAVPYVTFSHSVVQGSGGSGAWNNTFGLDGGGNVDADPLFVDAVGGDLRLSDCSSPAVNAGDNAAVDSVATDLDGNARIAVETVDIGAYELQYALAPLAILYVDSAAVGAGDGSSWTDAFGELRDAIPAAATTCGPYEIWVARGTYKPSSGADRSATFQLGSGVGVYGGFAGMETLRDERDWSANPTILSGDIGVAGDNTDNSYHVVTGSGADSTAVLDGFVVTGGAGSDGGGVYNVSGAPQLRNLDICANSGGQGGGVLNWTSAPSFYNCRIFGNTAANFIGGGMYNLSSSPTLVNVTFSGNAAVVGAGMYNATSHPLIVNTILWGDTSVGGPSTDEMVNADSTPTISHSLIKGSGGSGAWNGAYGTDAGGNLDTPPSFADSVNADLRLVSGSPAIDAGDTTGLNLPTKDLDANPRVSGATVDMGAYEFQAIAMVSATPPAVVFTDVPGNESTCDTIFVVNTGSVSLNLTGITGCGAAPFSIDTTMSAHTLAPGDTSRIVVCVYPTTGYPDSCTVAVTSNAMNSPTIIPVTLGVVTAVTPSSRPKRFRIVSVVPNPFNPTTTVHFTLPTSMPVTAGVWSIAGSRVRTLARKRTFGPGDNYLVWNGRNDQGSRVASGVYFIRVHTRLGTEIARAVLLK